MSLRGPAALGIIAGNSQICLGSLHHLKFVMKCSLHTRFRKDAQNEPTALWIHCRRDSVRKEEQTASFLLIYKKQWKSTLLQRLERQSQV